MKVLHLIVGLETGGAEAMLIKLLEHCPLELQQIVFTLKPHSAKALELKEKGYNMKKINLWNLIPLVAKEKPDLIMGWMFHGALLSIIVKKVLRIKVAWNIRYSQFPNQAYKSKSMVQILKHLSPFADAIIYNSHAGKKVHEELGYCAKNSHVIVNGFDLQKFKPQPDLKLKFKKNHQLPENSFVFGMVGRFDKLKNQNAFIKQAIAFLQSRTDTNRPIYFVFAGRNMDNNNEELKGLLNNSAKAERIILLGENSEVQKLYPCFDIHCLYSLTEGFPNVIGEAMACGVPCLATDVGDVKILMGSTGWFLPVNEVQALNHLLELAYKASNDELASRGIQARQRIEKEFSINQIAQQYVDFFKQININENS